MTWIPRNELLRLPKAELHCHLDGSLRPSTLVQLAREAKLDIPGFGPVSDDGANPEHPHHADACDAARNAAHAGALCEDLGDYLKAFDFTIACMHNLAAVERAAFELAVDAAAEGVRWLELRYGPSLLEAHGLGMEEVVAAVDQGLQAAEAQSEIHCGQILCGIKHCDPADSLRTAELATRLFAAQKYRVVGFDLAGAEEGGLEAHQDALALVVDAELPLTLHAGEACGPESIDQALAAGADRIGHGTRLPEDAELLEFVAWEQIPLEVCLSSNLQTRTITRVSQHPLLRFLAKDVPFALATDNRLMSDVDLCDELGVAVQAFDLGPRQLFRVLLNGFLYSFAPAELRDSLIDEAEQDLLRLLGA